MKSLEEIRKEILTQFDWFSNVIIEGDIIIIEEEYEMMEDEKNDDDCYDIARENGEMIIEKFPMLYIDEYYCHRHKYSIVTLKIKTTSSQHGH